jgi:hypothetical protein
MKHSIGVTVPAATLTEIFTVPNGFVAEVDMLYIANHTTGSKTASVYWKHAHDPSHLIYIVYQKSLSAKEFLQFSNGSIVFKPGDALFIQTEAGSDYTLIVTFDLRSAPAMYNFETE